MEALAQLEKERGNPEYPEGGVIVRGRTASKEMCTFLILNISSLQLIPVNVIAYRADCGSKNPAAILAPAILATLISTATAILFCRCKDRAVLR